MATLFIIFVVGFGALIVLITIVSGLAWVRSRDQRPRDDQGGYADSSGNTTPWGTSDSTRSDSDSPRCDDSASDSGSCDSGGGDSGGGDSGGGGGD